MSGCCSPHVTEAVFLATCLLLPPAIPLHRLPDLTRISSFSISPDTQLFHDSMLLTFPFLHVFSVFFALCLTCKRGCQLSLLFPCKHVHLSTAPPLTAVTISAQCSLDPVYETVFPELQTHAFHCALGLCTLLAPHTGFELDLSFTYVMWVLYVYCTRAQYLAYWRHLVNANSPPSPLPTKTSCFSWLPQHLSLSVTSESFFTFPVLPLPFHQLSTSANISSAVFSVAHSFAYSYYSSLTAI